MPSWVSEPRHLFAIGLPHRWEGPLRKGRAVRHWAGDERRSPR